MPAVALRINLLGTFRLLYHDEVVRGFDQARLQELLAYLLLHRDAPVARQQLAFLFWPDSTEEQARTNFRNLWHRLRRALPEADTLLAADELAVQWRGDDACWLDVAEFEAAPARAEAAAGPAERIAILEEAIALYAGELLPGHHSEWVLAERDRLAQLYAVARERLAALYEARRAYGPAIGHIQALLRHDPLHEPAWLQLMRLQALDGNRAAALHTYHTCATVLRRELDVEPGPATRELYERLLKARPAAPSPDETAVPLVGRNAEWAQLLQAWRAAAERPRLALITGEAGIGKTRLAEALAEWVGRQGLPALTARCYPKEAGGGLAYAPVVAWLRGAPRPRLADPWLRELARLLPEIAAERPDLPPPAPPAEPWQRLRLFEALTQAVLGRRAATLLILDDLQWCDRDTLDWLAYLLAAGAGPGTTHLLVVATLRDDERGADAALAAWRAGLARTDQLTEIALGPLSPAATLALAEHVAARPFDETLGPLLYQGTEGYPLFIVEMVRAGLARAAPPATGDQIDHATAMLEATTGLPGRVRQVLEARLGQLSPPARGVIDLAAAIGRAFSFDVLAAAGDLDEDQLVTALDECWRRRIIREQGADAYDFSHDKLREAAYAQLSRTRRHWLHGRVARALERVHAADLDGAAATIAGQYEAARAPEPAITYYARAATRARAVYAHDEARAALERGINLLATLPPGEPRSEWTTRLHEALGDLDELLAAHDAAREAYTVAQTATPATDRITRARLHRKMGKSLENERAGYDAAAAQYATAEALLGEPDENAGSLWWAEWCQVQIDGLLLLYWWNRPEEMARRIERALPAIERHGTPLQRAESFGNLSRHVNRDVRYAPTPAALAYGRAALEALPPGAGPEILSAYQFGLGFNLLWHGDPAEAHDVLQAALTLAEQTGDVTLQTRCLAYLAVAARRRGREAEVETFARRGLAAAEATGMADYIGACRGDLAWLAWRRGDLAEAEQQGRAALAAWQRHPAPHPFRWQALWPLIAVALVEERTDDAVDFARSLLDPAQQALPPAIEQSLNDAIAAAQPAAAAESLARAVAAAQQMNLA